MKYHKNFYNVEVETPDGLLLYNILNKNFVLLEGEYEDFYRNFPQIRSESLLKEFLEGGFILSDDVDERAYYLRNFISSRYFSRKLMFTIVPTTACNFRCVYCFESGIRYKNMTSEIFESTKKFIEKRIELFKPERVEITFYGGEPLLYLEKIVEFGRFFKELSKEKGFALSGDIVTNGYLLDLQAATLIYNEASVNTAQITLDGPPDVHDKRRFLSGGLKSFDRIISNISEIVNSELAFKIRLRVNVDKSNVESVGELLRILREHKGPKSEVYFSPVTGEKDKNCNQTGLFSIKEFGEVYMRKVVPWLLEYGFEFDLYPPISYVFCAGVTPFHHMIDADGTIKKCYDLVGRDEESIGTVADYREDHKDVLKWEIMPLIDSNCEYCKFLPLCGGGCPYQRFKMGKSVCEMWKYILYDWLVMVYQLKKEEVFRE